MAGVYSFQNLLGRGSSDLRATGIGAEKEVGVPEARLDVLVRTNNNRMAGRTSLMVAANVRDGAHLEEVGTTGIFTGSVSGDAFSIAEDVRAEYARAGPRELGCRRELGRRPGRAWARDRRRTVR